MALSLTLFAFDKGEGASTHTAPGNTMVQVIDGKVTFANEKCKQMFKASMGVEDFVGNHMGDCHQPETMEQLKKLFADYKERKRNLDYYTMVTPDGKLTIVNVPFYDGDTFAGCEQHLPFSNGFFKAFNGNFL